MSVLIAVNKTKQGSDNQILRNVKENFEGIFTVFSRAVDGGCPLFFLSAPTVPGRDTPSVEDNVFAVIIVMCSARILCLLRLPPTAGNPKGICQGSPPKQDRT